MTVNGVPRWTCRTHVDKVVRDDSISIGPLRNLPVIRDLVTDMSEFFDFDNPTFPNRELRRVNVDFPQWMVAGLDAEAFRLGINRQAVIKTWVAEKLDARALA